MQLLLESIPKNFRRESASGFIGKRNVSYLLGARLDEILSRRASPVVYYYQDIQGSIRGLTDSSSKLIQAYDYTAFGEEEISSHQKQFLLFDRKISQPYGFTGRPKEALTGLYYYRYRDYNPQTGRFLQPDPLGQVPGPNIYSYCSNNPVNWVDPWGRDMYYLRARKGAHEFGHTALLVGDSEHGYTYCSYGPEDGSTSLLDTRHFETFEEAEEYLSIGGQGGINRYDDYMKYNSNYLQDMEAVHTFLSESLYDYNFTLHNCDDVTMKSLLAGGVISKEKSWVSPNGNWDIMSKQYLYDDIKLNWEDQKCQE